MNKYIVGAILITTCACSPKAMSLDEQIAAVKACKEAGGSPDEIRGGWSMVLLRVDCRFGTNQASLRDKEGKPCIDQGGVPIFSSWDGTLKDCKFKGGK